MSAVPSVLETLERYYDAAPRSSADARSVGPLTLFVPRAGWPYYARPRLWLDRPLTVADVLVVRARQRELGLPETFEWVSQTTPSLEPVARAAGLVVSHHPLLVLAATPNPTVPTTTAVRPVGADDPDLDRVLATVALGFGAPGVARGATGPAERDAHAADSDPLRPYMRARLAEGHSVMVAAYDPAHLEHGPLAGGSHSPVGDVTELTGIATLPAARRRGLGAAVTAALVADAQARGVGTVFLSAGDEDIARVYERVGFRRVGTACAAAPAG